MTNAEEGLYPRFSEAEFRRRHQGVRALLQESGADALLIGGGPGSADVFYLTNYYPYMPAWVVFPRDGDPVIFHHFFNHNPCIREMSIVEDVRWYGPRPHAALADFLRERDLARAAIGVVGLANAIPYNQFAALQQELPETRFEDIGRAYQEMRWIRSGEELEWFAESARLTDLACQMLEDGIRPGLSEWDLSLLMHEGFLPEGGQLALQFMASTRMHAPDRFVPYQFPTTRVLEKGDVVITELTMTYWGYWSQIHRPFAVGEPPTAVYQELFDVALECYERVLAVLRPGTTSEEIIDAGSVVEQRGFGVYDSLFHGEMGKNPELGTPSSAHPYEPFTVRENMVMVIQPNPVTNDRSAGLQLGSAVRITADGAEALHRYPFKFPVCGDTR
jgi:Xaa-Pro dipeptidase